MKLRCIYSLKIIRLTLWFFYLMEELLSLKKLIKARQYSTIPFAFQSSNGALRTILRAPDLSYKDRLHLFGFLLLSQVSLTKLSCW